MGEERKPEDTVLEAVNSESRPAVELEQIFRDNHARVLRAAYRITGNAQDAEDVLQTVFLRLVRREGGSPLSDTLGNYLHRAAVNAALDVIRSRKAARSTPLEDVGASLAETSAHGPDEVQDGAELKQRIREALGHMNARAAEIFILRYFEGYGNHEIAKMLGTSRSTVNVILHRTRIKLREAIAPDLGETT